MHCNNTVQVTINYPSMQNILLIVFDLTKKNDELN